MLSQTSRHQPLASDPLGVVVQRVQFVSRVNSHQTHTLLIERWGSFEVLFDGSAKLISFCLEE